MKKSWRLLGSLVLLGVLAWRLDFHQVGAAFVRLRVELWLVSLSLFLAAQAVSSLRWQLLAQPLGFKGWWGQYLAYYYIGMFFNLLLPTSVGGDVVRAWYLANMKGAPPLAGRRLSSLLSVFVDRVSGLLVLVAVACVAAALCPVPLPAWMIGFLACMALGLVLSLAALPFLPRLGRVFARSPRLVRLADAASLYLGQPRLLLVVTFLSLVVQVINVTLVWLVGEGIGLPVPPLYYGILVPLVALLTLLPISLNGMGLREAGTVLLLAPLGVSTAAAVTLSLLTFSIFTVTSLGGLAFYLLGRFPRLTVAGGKAQSAEGAWAAETEQQKAA